MTRSADSFSSVEEWIAYVDEHPSASLAAGGGPPPPRAPGGFWVKSHKYGWQSMYLAVPDGLAARDPMYRAGMESPDSSIAAWEEWQRIKDENRAKLLAGRE